MAAPVTIGPFLRGMDNRVPDFELEVRERDQRTGHLLRDALNVDVTPKGSLRTRSGYAIAESGLDCHSLWSPHSGAYAIYCDAGDLYRLDVNDDGTTTRTQIAAGFGRLTPVVYAEVNEAVYFTDGIRVGSYHPEAGPTPRWVDAAPIQVGDVSLTRMPAGACMAHHNGRLLVAVGSVLVYSEPFTPGLRDEARGFEVFPSPITCVAAVEAGVFVASDRTYFLPGGLPAETLRAVLPYGAPTQAAGYREDGSAHWMTERGIVTASPAGELTNLQDDRVAIRQDVKGSAATLYREAGGLHTIVAALSTPSSTAAGVGSYAQARIFKKDGTP